MKSVDVDCPHCDQSLSVEGDQRGFDIECPTCGGEFFIEKDTSGEIKELEESVPKKFNLNQSSKSNSKKTNQNKNEKFVVENWMLYAGYYVLLIGIPILMMIFGGVFGFGSVAGIGGVILLFGVLNLANSLSLYIGMRICRVSCEVPAIIATSLIWALWETFVGPGGLIIFLFLFKHFTGGNIWPDAILVCVVAGIAQVLLALSVIGVIMGLLGSVGVAAGGL